MYIYSHREWPLFRWDAAAIEALLGRVRFEQGTLLGRMRDMGFGLRQEASLAAITDEVINTSTIEGEMLDAAQVRSSVARKIGLDIGTSLYVGRDVEGIVELTLNAVQHCQQPLTEERLHTWHAALFPTGRSGLQTIAPGRWRTNAKDAPMEVVSGPLGRQRVHYRAPDSQAVPAMMAEFLQWFNSPTVSTDPMIKAAVAHLWFLTIHPYDDGNGRIARAIADMQLTRADGTPQRYYSMSRAIRQARKEYYDILENTQRGEMEITAWIEWFLLCLQKAIAESHATVDAVVQKSLFWNSIQSVELNSRQRHTLPLLLDGFRGLLTSSKWAKINGCSQDTATRDLIDLCHKGILAKSPAGGRSTAYSLIYQKI